MATKKKMLEAAAGNAGGDPLDITDVFSTYLYDGTNQEITVTNNIDLATAGGMTWIKSRTNTGLHFLFDSERGFSTDLGYPSYYGISSNNNSAQARLGYGFTGMNSDGFRVGYNNGAGTNAVDSNLGASGQKYASWTFRKAPKFFDCVTWTGDGVANRTISHGLNTQVGMVVIKKTNTAGTNWAVKHKDVGMLFLNSSGAAFNTADTEGAFGTTAFTSTTFTVDQSTNTNANGDTYVAYVYAHNNSDGEFGPDADQDIIKCGSYVSNETTPPEITLGFEPQWILIKKSTGVDEWAIFDNMRGVPTGGNDAMLRPNLSSVEYGAANQIDFTSTGFKLTTAGLGVTNAPTGENYIYMAIRRGPLAPPTAGTEVFKVSAASGSPYNPNFAAPFSVDMAIQLRAEGGSSSYSRNGSRLTGTDYLVTSSTVAAGTSSNWYWDYNEGFFSGGASGTAYAPMWKRAPSFFDVVAYTGTGSGHTSPKHNLSVAPEMIWVKRRNNTDNWRVLNPNNRMDVLNGAGTEAAASTSAYYFGDDVNVVPPTSTEFTVHGPINYAESYIAYLFATLAGVSKVGSVTHSGTTNVDCGFSAGSRFVLLKRTDAPGGWYVWDSVRGIVSGNDPYFLLNSTAAEVTNTDYIDPLSSGFTITSNFTAGDYIFYAIA